MGSWSEFKSEKQAQLQEALKFTRELAATVQYAEMQERNSAPWLDRDTAEIYALHYYVTESDIDSGRCC